MFFQWLWVSAALGQVFYNCKIQLLWFIFLTLRNVLFEMSGFVISKGRNQSASKNKHKEVLSFLMTSEAIRNFLTPCFYKTLVLESYWGEKRIPICLKAFPPNPGDRGCSLAHRVKIHPLHEDHPEISCDFWVEMMGTNHRSEIKYFLPHLQS